MTYALSAQEQQKFLSIINHFKLPDLQEVLHFSQQSKSGNKKEVFEKIAVFIRHPNAANTNTQLVLEKIRRIARERYPSLDLDNMSRGYQHNYPANARTAAFDPYRAAVGSQRLNFPVAPTPPGRPAMPAIQTLVPPHKGSTAENVARIPVFELPYFKVLTELQKLTPLEQRTRDKTQECRFELNLPAEFAKEMMYKISTQPLPRVEVLMRMFPCDSSGIQQDDYPQDLSMKIGRTREVQVNLPALNPPARVGQIPKRQSRYTDLTAPVQDAIIEQQHPYKAGNPTKLRCSMSWTHNADNNHVYRIDVVRHVTSAMLLEEFKHRVPVELCVTRDSIRMHLDRLAGDDDVKGDDESYSVTLKCAITMTRMKYPVRGDECTHFQCFDMATWLVANEKRPTCKCPICSKRVAFSKMQPERYFMDMLSVCGENVTKVKLLPTGAWVAYDENDVMLFGSNADGSVDGLVKVDVSTASLLVEKIEPVTSGTQRKRPADSDVICLSDEEDQSMSTRSRSDNVAEGSSGDAPAQVAQNDVNVSSGSEIVVLDDSPPPPQDPLQPGSKPVQQQQQAAQLARAAVAANASIQAAEYTRQQHTQQANSIAAQYAQQQLEAIRQQQTAFMQQQHSMNGLPPLVQQPPPPVPTEPCNVRWQKTHHDTRESLTLTAHPSAHAIKMILDSDEFFALGVVKQFIARSPAEHKMRVLYAYAQALAICDSMSGTSTRARAVAMWPARDDPWKDNTYPDFPFSNDQPIHYSNRLQSYITHMNSASVVELFVSASTQCKDYPCVTIVVPIQGMARQGAYVAKTTPSSEEPPAWIMQRVKRRVDGEQAQTRTQQAAAQSAQHNPYRTAHAASAAATHPSVISTARTSVEQMQQQQQEQMMRQQYMGTRGTVDQYPPMDPLQTANMHMQANTQYIGTMFNMPPSANGYVASVAPSSHHHQTN